MVILLTVKRFGCYGDHETNCHETSQQELSTNAQPSVSVVEQEPCRSVLVLQPMKLLHEMILLFQGTKHW